MIRTISLYLILISMFSVSCTRYRDITYMRDVARTPSDTIFKNSYKQYKVQVSDLLYVKVTTLDETINTIFNTTSSTQGSSSASANNSNYYLIGYPVDIDGNITLPIMGKIKVEGLTLKEIQSAIEELSTKYLTNAKIDIRLLSFKVTLLGQVNHPGQITIMADKANIFEGLAMGGDISIYGNRHDVLIMRPDKTGGNTVHRIDLTDKTILTSEYFYLLPNDIIYVEPTKIAGFRYSVNDYSLLISTVSTTVSIILLFKLIKL